MDRHSTLYFINTMNNTEREKNVHAILLSQKADDKLR